MMLHTGLDLSRRRLDYCLLDEEGDRLEVGACPPDADGLAGLARRIGECYGSVPVRAAIESMNGARLVHDSLERAGWQVEVADAQKVKGLAPLVCKTDRIDAWVLAKLSRRDLVPAIWLPAFAQRAERERSRWRLYLVRKRSSLKHRIHAQLLAFGHACPVADLFGARGRVLPGGLDFPEPWRGGVEAALSMIDDLDRQIHGMRWALMDAATHACRHPLYRARHQATKRRLGRQRGPKVAMVDIARRLAEAIWHMLTRNQPFAPAGATQALAA